MVTDNRCPVSSHNADITPEPSNPLRLNVSCSACGMFIITRDVIALVNEPGTRIDDRIIAEIRRSGLLVSDVTGHRNAVYFEAGFAMGLGIPVIWTCRNDHIERANFDTPQYNHIAWQRADELKTKLIDRIEATGLTRNANLSHD